jgi:hypothetical protein
MGNTQAKSTDNEINQIINLLGHEEKYLQTIMGLLTFGVFKYIVFPFLKDLNDPRKEYLRKKNTARDAPNQTSSPTDPVPVPEPPMSAPEPPNTSVSWNK